MHGRRKSIRYVALITVSAVFGACSETTAPSIQPPAEQPQRPSQLVALGDAEFTATVGTTIEPGPIVQVLDANNRPVAGVRVTFGSKKVVVSDPDGIARFGPWQLDTVAGPYFLDSRVLVSVDTEIFLVFHAQATPGPLAHFTALAGNNQVGEPGRTLPNQLHVRATDIYNNAISGLVVSFAVASGAGKVEHSTGTTDRLGLATAGRWTLGSASPQRVSAQVGNFQANFDAAFCGQGQACEVIPSSLAYVRDGAIWISTADEQIFVAQNGSRPSWSQDGSRLAFFKVNANGEDEAICIASEPFSTAACTPVDVISREIASEMRVSWSPDGRTLALSRAYYGPGDAQLLFVDVATMTIRRHGTIDQQVLSASWSPDGKSMAIASDSKVYLANAAGSDLQVLLPYPVWELAWAPDGKKIGVITLGCGWECFGVDIGVVDVQTKHLEIVEHGQLLPSGLTWSPDSDRVAYSTGDYGFKEVRILSLADRTSEVVLTNASDPSWRR